MHAMDNTLLQAATNSLQAQECLCNEIKTKLKDHDLAHETISKCLAVLEQLREIKSRMEGTYFQYQSLSLDADKLTALKYHVTAHTPSTLHEAHKTKMAESIMQVFEDQVKRVLYACVLTCPWSAGAQSEVSAQAQGTLLYVVYVSSDEQFFSLATPHEKELAETVDQGVVFAADVRHYCSQLQKGNVRAIEALCVSPECVVLATPTWFQLVAQLNPTSLLGKSFVERCLGQAVGALVRKKKVNGRLVLRDDVNIFKFCDSLRLLNYVDCVKEKLPLTIWTDDVVSTSPHSSAKEAMKLLTKAFKGVFNKEGLLQFILTWKERLEGVEPANRSEIWTPELGVWLSEVRLDGVILSPPIQPSDTDKVRLGSLMCEIGMDSIPPADILAVCEAGSRLYNLALPTSDTDYIVLYRYSTQELIATLKYQKESHDNRGQNLAAEAGAYEARMFCDMLLKGAVNIVEMIFAGDSLYYQSELWRELVKHKDQFLSEEVIYQYKGYIKTHMKLLWKHAGTPRERKIFYNIFHKLLSLEAFIEGKPPIVKCSEEQREFIMSIRRGPLEGHLSPENLKLLAETKLSSIGEKLRARKSRQREFGDYNTLQRWLLSVRGVELRSELKMGCKPLAALTPCS